MEIKFGLISADSHIVLDKDAFLRNMSHSKWGELIPQVQETEGRDGRKGDRWFIHGESAGGWGVVNCPAVMESPNPELKIFPQRWADVPAKVWDPLERLEALDDDGIDAEILFPNDPGRGQFFRYGEEFELACVEAHNDATA